MHRATSGKGMPRNAPSPYALAVSALFHGLLIAAAFLGARYFPADAPRTLYAQLIAPEENKIIWYPLRQLPPIAPTRRIGTAPVPQGREKRNRAIIRDDPDAKPGKQLLWRPDSQKQIDREMPAPNLVAIETPPEPVKPRNIFHLPEPAPAVRKSLETPPPPVPVSGLPSKPAAALPGFLAALPKATRPFVAPPPPPAPSPKPVDVIDAPPVASGELKPAGDGRNGALAAVLGNGPGPSRRQFVVPPAVKAGGSPGAPVKLQELDAPPTVEGVNAAILSTSPLDKLLTAIPDGSRPAQLSAAPTVGALSSGPVKPAAGLRMAGVAVAGGGPALSAKPPVASVKLPAGPVRTVYEETRNAVRRTSLSAPLRPSSRIIPQAIESRFHDRVAYSIIVAKPRLPVYAGDWVLWFAEKLPRAGSAPQMRAPQPLRKVEALDDLPSPGPAGRIQFAATILKTGQIDSIVVLNGAQDSVAQAAAIKDLRSWQFAPALRDGEAVDVEAVLEIIYQLSNNISSPGTPRH